MGMGKLTSLLIICCFLSGFMMIASGCGDKKEEITFDLIVNIKGKKYLNTEMVLYFMKEEKKKIEKAQKIPALRETVIRTLSNFDSEKQSIEDAKRMILDAIKRLNISVEDLYFNKFVMQ